MTDRTRCRFRLVLGGPVTLFAGGPVILPWHGPMPGRGMRRLLAWWFELRFEESRE